MGTRGFVGVVVAGEEKIAYNHMDSGPRGLGTEVLEDLRALTGRLGPRQLTQAAAALTYPEGRTLAEVLATHPDLAEQVPADHDTTGVVEDWHEYLRFSSLPDMLELGLYDCNRYFPLMGSSCAWGYLVDLDADNGRDQPPGRFEVYRGYRRAYPDAGRWAHRPTATEQDEDHAAHLAWCAEHGRDPWLPKVPEFKAVQLVASWPLGDLPSIEDFLAAVAEPATR